MSYLILKNKKQENWIYELANVVTNIDELLNMLNLKSNSQYDQSTQAKKIFPLRVPKTFISRMKKNNPFDPLLLQVLPRKQELIKNKKFHSKSFKRR